MTSGVKFQKLLSSTVGLLVIFAIILAINIITGSWRWRKDLTEEQLYTLSSGTKQLLNELDRDITLKFYFSKSVEGVPIPLKQFAERIADLLHEYESESDGQLLLETYDPRPDSDEQEWAQRYGLTGKSLGMLGMSPSLYIGIVAVSGTKEAAIPFLAPNVEPQLEYLVTRLIHEVTKTKKPKVAILSSLPVMGDSPPPAYLQQQRPSENKPWFVVTELQKLYEVTTLETNMVEVADDIDTVILIHPKNLSDESLFALDQYVLSGGKLLALLDPMCMAEQENANSTSPTSMFGASSEINALTKAWGIELNTSDVVADQNAASSVSFGNTGSVRTPTWLTIRSDQIDNEEVATSSLESLMMPFAGGFKGEAAEGLEMVSLVKTSADAGFLSAYEAISQNANLLKNLRAQGELPLVVRLKGKFKSAFPEGSPKSTAEDETAEENDEDSSSTKETYLTESIQDSAVVLVGDADMIQDRMCVRSINFFGQSFNEPLNDNLNFVLNMIEQLVGSEALIGLRSRGTFQRPFHKVIELEQAAQSRWREEEVKLQEKLKQAQARLNQLQVSKDKDQEYILSPAQKKEIESFRKEEFEAKRQLKEVRKNLRKDIESLGMKIKIANMGLIPLAVAIFGLYRGFQRRRSTS